MLNKQREKLGSAYKNSTVSARALGLVFVVVIVALVVMFIMPMFTNSTLENEYEDYSDATGASVSKFDNIIEEETNALIEDPYSESGQLALTADQERVAEAQRKNRSVIAALTPAEPESNGLSLEDQLRKLASGATDSTLNKNQDKNWLTDKPEPRENTEVDGREKNRKSANNQLKETDSGNGERTDSEKEKDILAGIPKDQLELLIQEEMKKSKMNSMGIVSEVLAARQHTSGGFKPFKDYRENPSLGTDSKQNGANRTSQSSGRYQQLQTAGSDTGTSSKKEKPVILPQGAKLTAESDWPVDSRFNKSFVLTINYGKLENATLSCEYTRTDNVLIPTCSDITYQGNTTEISAVMLNPQTMGPVIDQYRDSETLLDWMGLLITGTAKTYGENKLKQGTQTETTDTKTVTTQDLTDAELVAGSVSTIVGSLSAKAMAAFTKEDIINVPANVPMIVALLQPLRADWDVGQLESGEDYL